MTPTQCRMARAALNLTIYDLAALTGAGVMTISAFERGERNCLASTIEKLRDALEAEGVAFLDDEEPSLKGGVGVRLKGE